MHILYLLLLLSSFEAFSFCGFYVAKADSSLYNKASQVIIVRDGNKTAMTMFNDYKGEAKDFALVVPVPEVLTREQINVADRSVLERIDAFTAPRLVEYFDPDPCSPALHLEKARAAFLDQGKTMGTQAKSLGVTIEAQYTVGEYDIVILGAKESSGLKTWLDQQGYKIPGQAAKALEPYIKQKLKFFVAKVNLEEQAKSGFTYLRPIQFAFESPRFMLPIRLGMANADGPQDLLIYAVTPRGRVETTNYRTVKLPTDKSVPLYIKNKFPEFYRSVFDTAYTKENKKVVFMEYAWNMAWCDPCAADPLTPQELRKIGVFWLEDGDVKLTRPRPGGFLPNVGGGAVQAYVTRLHVRYSPENFPEDLMFQETGDQQNFQGRYILNHPYEGKVECDGGKNYEEGLKQRRYDEAKNLAMLTHWKMNTIVKEMGLSESEIEKNSKKWYQNIFK